MSNDLIILINSYLATALDEIKSEPYSLLQRALAALKEKCDHNVEHKEVLGHVLCVCCVHCQERSRELEKNLKDSEARLEIKCEHGIKAAQIFPCNVCNSRFNWPDKEITARVKETK